MNAISLQAENTTVHRDNSYEVQEAVEGPASRRAVAHLPRVCRGGAFMERSEAGCRPVPLAESSIWANDARVIAGYAGRPHVPNAGRFCLVDM